MLKSLIVAKLAKLNSAFSSFNYLVEEAIRRSIFGDGGSNLPALVSIGSQNSTSKPVKSEFSLRDIIDKGILWCPTPKKRTTAEKK